MTRCHCGKPLHYTDPRIEELIWEQVRERGEFLRVTVAGRTFLVQRHYIALHGLKASELPGLGFKEIIVWTGRSRQEETGYESA